MSVSEFEVCGRDFNFYCDIKEPLFTRFYLANKDFLAAVLLQYGFKSHLVMGAGLAIMHKYGKHGSQKELIGKFCLFACKDKHKNGQFDFCNGRGSDVKMFNPLTGRKDLVQDPVMHLARLLWGEMREEYALHCKCDLQRIVAEVIPTGHHGKRPTNLMFVVLVGGPSTRQITHELQERQRIPIHHSWQEMTECRHVGLVKEGSVVRPVDPTVAVTPYVAMYIDQIYDIAERNWGKHVLHFKDAFDLVLLATKI